MSVISDHDRRIIHSSEDPNWRTPKECFEKLDAEFAFHVDAAADETSALCPDYFGPGGSILDALAEPWASHTISGEYDYVTATRFFLNAPFSRTLAAAYRTGRIKRNGAWVEHEKDPIKSNWYEIGAWVEKCWFESRNGATIVALIPFAPQTDWYRNFVYGHEWNEGAAYEGGPEGFWGWAGHAAREERRLPHRISYLRPDGSPASNAGVNTAVVVWKPNPGIVGPWQPHQFYWSYR